MQELKFDQKAIQDADEYYKKIHFKDNQKQIMDLVMSFISQFIPIPERALRGFMWQNLKNWQVENHKDLSYIAEASPNERLQIAIEILESFKVMLTRILIDEEQEPLLNEAIIKATNYYKEKFANR